MGAIRTAVVGAGSMGRNHARVLSRMEDVQLVGIVDTDRDSAAVLAEATDSVAYTNTDALPQIDLAVVAVPTIAHLAVAEALMERGVSVLVEKPLASTPDDADRLVDIARRHEVVLAVGHIERFNPVVSTLARLVTRPRLMQFSRLSPYTPRIQESIVFDLMVHDLDLACLLAGDYPTSVSAGGVKTLSETLDAATAVLTFPDGCIASVTASRITQDKVRRISVSESERFFDADCMRQELSIKRETTGEFTVDATYQQASVVEIPYLDRRAEPLALELRNVVDAVGGTAELQVDGGVGAAAVRLAHEVERMALH